MLSADKHSGQAANWREQVGCLLRVTPRACILQPRGMPSVITINIDVAAARHRHSTQHATQHTRNAAYGNMFLPNCHAQLTCWYAREKGSFQGSVTTKTTVGHNGVCNGVHVQHMTLAQSAATVDSAEMENRNKQSRNAARRRLQRM